nr:PREDICTED: dual specificity protein kinase splB-like [Linepithema humile]
MAKRKVSLRRSKRFSGNRSSSLYNSTVLDSNSTILGEESRFWWNDLEENTSLRYSLIRNNGNETTQQLSQNSETKSDQNTLQWYKYLSSDSEHNASNSKENFNRVAVKTHRKVIASTTSESENEVDVTKAKRFNLRPARKTTEKNVFLDVLNTDTGTNSDSGSLNNKNSQIKLHESIEDSPNLSIRLKPNIFKKKRGNKVEDRNIFQDVLAKNSILDSSIRKKSFGLDKEFLQNSTSQNIDTNKDHINDQRKGSIKLSQALSLDNEIDSSDVSTLKNQNATFENNIMSDIDETEHGNDKSKRLGKRMKSYFSRRARRSTGRNAFEIALADDQDISALNASKKQLLNISKEKNKDNIEEDTSSSSLNNNEIRKSVKFSKSKIKYSRSHNKSLNENSQKEPFEQNNTNGEQTLSILTERLSNLSPGKETRLTRNSSKTRFETPTPTKKRARKVTNDDLEHNINEEQNSDTLVKRLPNSSSGKETRLTRNSSKTRFETPTPTKKRAREITNDDLEHNINEEQNSDTLVERLPNSSSGKETRLTRNTSRIRSETPTPTKKGAREITNDNSEYDMNKEQDSSTLDKEPPNSSPGKKTRLTRNTSRIRSETPTPTKKGAREITNDNSEYDMNKEQDSSTLDKELSKSSSGKEARLTHNSSQSRYKTPNFTSGAKLSTQSANKNVHIEDVDVDSVSTISEINVDDSLPITSSTRISSAQINEGVKAHKNATLFFNTADEEDVFATQMVQRKYSSPGNRTSNKTINQQTLSTVVNLNSIKENKETAHRQKSLNRSSQNGSTPIKALSKNISIRNKLNSPKKLKTIDDFFKVKQSSTTVAEPSTSNNKNLAPLQTFNEKMEKIKMELETRNQTKSHEVAATDKKKYELKVRNANPVSIVVKQRAKNKVPAKSTKKVDKAFLVNGEVYRVPRLPRPKYWVTDHLYKFLWNRMEEKYKFATRIKSEKFVQELSKIVSFICNSKKYDSYKMELKALMKEMARLNIIKTRNDFYNFCWDFMPYEFRVKAVPMLLPDNKRTIPYDPEMLHTPLLSDDHYDD